VAVFVFMRDVMVSEGIDMPAIRVTVVSMSFDPKKKSKSKKLNLSAGEALLF